MRRQLTFGVLIAAAALLSYPAWSDQTNDDDGVYASKDSAEFDASFNTDNAAIRKSTLNHQFKTPTLGAATGERYEQIIKDIRAERPIKGLTTGSAGKVYDIIIQPGHYGRPPGHVGTSGKLVSERALNSYLVSLIADQLRSNQINVAVIPADGSASGMSAKVFLAIHADGTTNPCHTGPSMAYKRSSSMFPMHALGAGLARAYGYKYEDFKRDNFTVDEAHYYMFSRVSASMMTGLLEVGELTCPKSEIRLVSSTAEIASNISDALTFLVHLK